MAIDTSVIDQSLVAEYEPEFLGKITALFIKNARNELGLISDAIQQNDFEQARQYCHKIKGSSLLVGAIHVSNSAKKMEQMARNEDPAIKDELDNLTRQFGGFEQYAIVTYELN